MGAFSALVKQDDCGFSKGMIEDDLTFPEYPVSMVLCNLY